MEEKTSKKLLNLHRNIAMQSQKIQEKVPDTHWKYYPTLDQEIQEKKKKGGG